MAETPDAAERAARREELAKDDADQRAELERLRAEIGVYRTALNRIGYDAPRPGDQPRYIAKDALRRGVRVRSGKAAEAAGGEHGT